MALRTLTPKSAAALDAELMGPLSYTIDQLMELAGLSVACSVHALAPPSTHPRVLVACGPGNNGGDGLAAARHLVHFGYGPVGIYWPKRGKADIYGRLLAQAVGVGAREVGGGDEGGFEQAIEDSHVVVDAVFGFSFGGEVREPFPKVIRALEGLKGRKLVLAVDTPSGWSVDAGPPDSGPGQAYMPDGLVSLTAPKPLVKWFEGRHWVGGRFLGKELADKYGIDVPEYKGTDQVVEVPVRAGKL